MTDAADKKRPVHEVRLRNVVAAIWANPTDDGRTFYAVTPYRVYQAGDGWHRTTSFDRDDLPLLTWVANRAFDFIAAAEATPAPPPAVAADARPTRPAQRSGPPRRPG